MSDTRYVYYFQAGTKDFRRYGMDDRSSRRLFARWLRRFWQRYAADIHERYPGSMADAEDNGWYHLPEAIVARERLLSGDVIPATGKPNVIERFAITPEAIAEFARVWARPTLAAIGSGK